MPEASPRVRYLKGASVCPAADTQKKFKSGWKGLRGTNTVAYYKHKWIGTKNCTIGPRYQFL